MDNITHSLTGLALARAGLNRACPQATLLLVLSANVPDIDILSLVPGYFNKLGPRLTYFEAHRGYTHSLLCLPLMALFTVAFVAVVTRRRLPAAITRPRVTWLTPWLLCCLGVASHLLLDWTNSYGIRLLLPFSSAWLHLDLNGLYDFAIWGVLAFAAIWPFFAGLVGSEIGAKPARGRGLAIAALIFFAAFDGARAVLHARAVSQLNARVYGDDVPIATAAMPSPASLLRWYGIVETSAAYFTMDLDSLSNNFDPSAAEIYYKPPLDSRVRAAEASENFRFFEYFARFPLWSEYPLQIDCAAAVRVELADLRFGRPRAGAFEVTAAVNARNQLVSESPTGTPCSSAR